MKTNKILAVISALAVLAGAASSARANLVANGDFTANAAAFVNAPGFTSPDTAGNPASIAGGWINISEAYSYGAAYEGVNGAGTGVGNVYGPANPGGHTYATLVMNPGAPFNWMGQVIALAPNTSYKIDMDVAANAGGAAFEVKMIDAGNPAFYSSGTIMATPHAFTHYTFHCSTPSVLAGPYTYIQLMNNSGTGLAVDFANVSVVVDPTPNLIVNGQFTANAAAFTGAVGGAGQPGNPSGYDAISGWINYFLYASISSPFEGINGLAATYGANIFGPIDPRGRTFAFLQGNNNMLAQFLTTLQPNTTYQLDYDVAARNGNAGALYQVYVAADATLTPALYYNSGVTAANPQNFDHIRATFTTGPAAMTGTQNIQLWNVSPAGDYTVDFANVSLIAIPTTPTPARTTIVSDNYNIADGSLINDSLATRQSGNQATIGYFEDVTSAGTFTDQILGGTLSLTENVGGGNSDAVLLAHDLALNIVNNTYRLECDVTLTPAAPGDSWTSISLRSDAWYRMPGGPNNFSLLLRPNGGYSICDGMTLLSFGSVVQQPSYHVVVDVQNSVATITINGVMLLLGDDLYSHAIVNANPGPDNYIGFHNFCDTPVAPQTLAVDNVTVSTLAPPAVTLIHPAYDKVTGNASFQFTSVANGYYVGQSKANLTDPWTTFGSLLGTGAVETVTLPSATPTAFFRVFTPAP